MSWIKKTEGVEVAQEMEYESNRIEKTDAMEVEITEAYLQNSQQDDSKSVSVVIAVKDKDGLTNRSRFTIMGRNGETFFESTFKGKKVKKQHFGLSIVNTLFMIALDKEIFDIEPSETKYTQWNKEDKEMEDVTGDGFPDLIGKKIGICHQMIREIDGTDTKEWGEIAHFFDIETGLFAGEEESDNTKLDKWMHKAEKKPYIIKEASAKPKSSFGRKKADGEAKDGEEKPRKKWGKR